MNRKYLAPVHSLPVDGAIDHVAVLLEPGRRLGAKISGDGQRVAATAGHFVNAVDVAGLNAAAAGLRARRKVGNVPARRARDVVARPRDRIRPRFDPAQRWIHLQSVGIPRALRYRFLHSFKKKRTNFYNFC